MDEREPSFLGARQGEPFVLPQPPAAARIAPIPRSEAPTLYVAGLCGRILAGLLDAGLVPAIVRAVVWLASRLAGLPLPSPRKSAVDYWLGLALAGDPGLLAAIGLGAAVLVLYLLLFQALTARTL